jgi:uncharacterized protein (TIGR00730 family)
VTTSDKTIVIFGSSSVKPGDTLYSDAEELGKLLALEGFRICNGGYNGIMEASAKGAKKVGGTSIGITTKALKGYKKNPWIDDEVIREAYLDRMGILFEKGDAFLALSGGVGTFSELFTLWCLLAIGAIQRKPFILVGEAWREFLAYLANHFIFGAKETEYLTPVPNIREAVKSLKIAFGSMQLERV